LFKLLHVKKILFTLFKKYIYILTLNGASLKKEVMVKRLTGSAPFWFALGPEYIVYEDSGSPVTHDDEDDHGDEEDQAGRRRADDEGQLLLDAGVVLLWKRESTHVAMDSSGRVIVIIIIIIIIIIMIIIIRIIRIITTINKK